MPKWDKEKENLLKELKGQGKSNKDIACRLGVTVPAVKHKWIRLCQAGNADSHHHPIEKIAQVERVLAGRFGLRVLETHAGTGNLTKAYSRFAREVVACEIATEKCAAIEELHLLGVRCLPGDSLRNLYGLLYRGEKFDVVDVDPYGYPSHYFPHVLELVDNGYVFVTIPRYGCAQLNKITATHLRVFYGFAGGNNQDFLAACIETLKTLGLRTYREIEVVEVDNLQKVYRLAVKVTKRNAFELVGYDHLLRKDKQEASV